MFQSVSRQQHIFFVNVYVENEHKNIYVHEVEILCCMLRIPKTALYNEHGGFIRHVATSRMGLIKVRQWFPSQTRWTHHTKINELSKVISWQSINRSFQLHNHICQARNLTSSLMNITLPPPPTLPYPLLLTKTKKPI